MKLKSVNMEFRDLIDINRKLKQNTMQNTVIDEELASLIRKKLLSTTKSKNVTCTNIDTIMQDQKATLTYTKDRGWTVITLEATVFGDLVKITNDNGGGLGNKEKTSYFKIIN